jgi:hypothetical protein
VSVKALGLVIEGDDEFIREVEVREVLEKDPSTPIPYTVFLLRFAREEVDVVMALPFGQGFMSLIANIALVTAASWSIILKKR